jgi:2,4-dienoyl-CoA reductase-like NADH-dependent reductase (Old Yellow Enzyme family)/thioredoxin reductase
VQMHKLGDRKDTKLDFFQGGKRMKDKLEKLFEPIQVGSMRLKNRLVLAPMGTEYADDQGMVTPQQILYYAERARNGLGMITIECASVSTTGRSSDHQLAVYKDDFIPGLGKLAGAIKEHGCRCVLQIHHAGRRAASKFNKGTAPLAPSPIPCIGGEVPEELTADRIERIVEDFGNAALRAKRAGFDAVELHGAHGYLINQFLSPLSNQRADNYGGTLENRTRFVTEIIAHIKDKVGKDYPILIKLSVDEYLSGGLTPKDTGVIAKILEDAGVSAITASAGHTGARAEGYARTVPGSYFPRGCYVHLAEAIKGAVRVPVGAVGRINDPILAESILREDKADLIYMGRALFADPELPVKAMQGRFDDIRTCLACNTCQKSLHTNLCCAVNAALGKEETYRIMRVQKPKKVLVVGGGPAGMEAARVASIRGHKVFLYEKEHQLGGQLLLAAIPPHKDEIPNLVRYLSTQLRELGVKVEVNKEAKPETVKQLRPDVLIIATGSVPFVPEIPGVESNNVVLAEEVLTGKTQLKNGAIVVAGGGIVGCETAEFLATEGKNVTIVRRRPEIAEGLEETARLHFKKRLTEYGVTILTGARVQRVTRKGAVLENGREIAASAVVLAVGGKARNTLTESLKGIIPEIYAIGDCVEPRMIVDAIREGAAVAYKI